MGFNFWLYSNSYIKMRNSPARDSRQNNKVLSFSRNRNFLSSHPYWLYNLMVGKIHWQMISFFWWQRKAQDMIFFVLQLSFSLKVINKIKDRYPRTENYHYHLWVSGILGRKKTKLRGLWPRVGAIGPIDSTKKSILDILWACWSWRLRRISPGSTASEDILQSLQLQILSWTSFLYCKSLTLSFVGR